MRCPWVVTCNLCSLSSFKKVPTSSWSYTARYSNAANLRPQTHMPYGICHTGPRSRRRLMMSWWRHFWASETEQKNNNDNRTVFLTRKINWKRGEERGQFCEEEEEDRRRGEWWRLCWWNFCGGVGWGDWCGEWGENSLSERGKVFGRQHAAIYYLTSANNECWKKLCACTGSQFWLEGNF